MIANTPLGMFQEVLADRNRLIGELAQLRAELERVTAERDAARKYHTVEYEQRREAERELAEARAARETDWSEYETLASKLAETEVARLKWYQQLCAEHDAHNETKAARAQDRERDTRTMQDLLDINSDTLDATYRELAEVRAALADCADRVHPDEHAAALAELDQLRRAWALRELRDMADPGLMQITLEQWIAYRIEEIGGLPESVTALIQAGAGLQIGECDECGKTAPLVVYMYPVRGESIGVRSMACAPGWPCGTGGA